MNAAIIAGGVISSILIIGAVYGVALRRARLTMTLIGSGIASLTEAAREADESPQRALLRSVAGLVVAQESAAGRMATTIREAGEKVRAARAGVDPGSVGVDIPEAEDVLRELLALPEPQALIVEFLVDNAGSAGVRDAFDALGAGMARVATVRAFADLAVEDRTSLEKLLAVADRGSLAAVAGAAIGLAAVTRGEEQPGTGLPRASDLDSDWLAGAARALDGLIRRQLRLATVLHGQAEAITRLRDKHAWRPGDPAGGPAGGLPKWRLRLLAFLRPSDLAKVGRADLAELEVILDSVGEATEAAAEQLARGDASHAIYLLAGVRVPVPAGLPGRMFRQESLARARPLAAVAAWHRLAVSRWVIASLAELEREAR